MAEPEIPPPNSVTTITQPATTTESIVNSRHSRIHFPIDGQDISRPGPSAAEGSRKASTAALSSSPTRQNSPLVPRHGSPTAQSRRRAHSIDKSNISPSKPRTTRTPATAFISSKRGTITNSTQTSNGDKDSSSLEYGAGLDDFGPGVFPDEYDLCELFYRLIEILCILNCFCW